MSHASPRTISFSVCYIKQCSFHICNMWTISLSEEHHLSPKLPPRACDWQPQFSGKGAVRVEVKNTLRVLPTLKVNQMSGCWTICTGILDWSNFCALASGGRRRYLSPDKKSIQIQLWVVIVISCSAPAVVFLLPILFASVQDTQRKKTLFLCKL